MTKLREACDEARLETTPSSAPRCGRCGRRRGRSSPPSSTPGPPPASPRSRLASGGAALAPSRTAALDAAAAPARRRSAPRRRRDRRRDRGRRRLRRRRQPSRDRARWRSRIVHDSRPGGAGDGQVGPSAGAGVSRRAPQRLPQAVRSLRRSADARLRPRPRRAHGRPAPTPRRRRHRDIERSAPRSCSAPSRREVRADAAKVFEAVHAADGIVLRSSIRDGAAGDAGADFELLIPTAKLGDALASFSAIAEVRSRHESTQDITAPTVRRRRKAAGLAAPGSRACSASSPAPTPTPSGPRSKPSCSAERHQAAALRSGSPACSGAPTSPTSRCGSRPAPLVGRRRRRRLGSRRRPRRRRPDPRDRRRGRPSSASRSSPRSPLIALLGWLARRAWLAPRRAA